MSAIDLVYGIVEDPASALARQRHAGSGRPALGPMSAAITAATPALRLNTAGWSGLAAEAAGLSGTDAQLRFCRERLCNRVSIFSLPIRAFVNAYLDFSMSEIERRRAELESRIDMAGLPRDLGFPTYRDWIFSTLLPLPNVYVATDTGPDGEPFVRVDLLFWDGASAIAIILEGRNMPTPRTSRALRRLQEQHRALRLIRMPYISGSAGWAFGKPFLDLFGGDLLPRAGLPFGIHRVLQGSMESLAPDKPGPANRRPRP